MAEALDIEAVADAVAEATSAGVSAPPPPLPNGWILKESRSFPSFYYYFYIPTGLSSWQPPMQSELADSQVGALVDTKPQLPLIASTAGNTPSQPSEESAETQQDDAEDADDRSSKRRKATTTASPKEVRVLHILKKHKDSRRPTSWRNAKITSTPTEAKQELEGVLEILLEEEGNLDELRATFEELARTESDCSSAKRGGDLGFFGRRKMQPAFEEASFALEIGQLTKQVFETSSGMHLILRIG